MLQKFFEKFWILLLLHLFVSFATIFNGYYLLESWKINKSNIRLNEMNTSIIQNISDLKNQNSFEALDQYKDKIIKKSGYRKLGEQIYDISAVDGISIEEKEELTEKNKNNNEKWATCLFGKNKLITENIKTSCR